MVSPQAAFIVVGRLWCYPLVVHLLLVSGQGGSLNTVSRLNKVICTHLPQTTGDGF